MKHKTPRWFGLFTLVFGLYVLVYLFLTAGSITEWIFPTGIIAFILIAAGLRWTFPKTPPPTPKDDHQ